MLVHILLLNVSFDPLEKVGLPKLVSLMSQLKDKECVDLTIARQFIRLLQPCFGFSESKRLAFLLFHDCFLPNFLINDLKWNYLITDLWP